MISRFMTDTVQVLGRTMSQNAMGGIVASESVRIASLPCRISSRRGFEAQELGKETVRAIWRLYCQADSDSLEIADSDVIVDSDDQRYEIIAIHNPGRLNRHLQIDLLELR